MRNDTLTFLVVVLVVLVAVAPLVFMAAIDPTPTVLTHDEFTRNW